MFYSYRTIYAADNQDVYTPPLLQYTAYCVAKGGEWGGCLWSFISRKMAFCKGGCYGIISYTSILLPSLLVIMRSRTFRYCVMSVALAVLPTCPRLS